LPLVPAGAQIAPFSVAGGYMVMAGEWAFQSTTNTTLDPRAHTYIPDSLPAAPSGNAPMFGIAFDDYFMGSLLYSATQNKMFDFSLDNSKLPPGSPIQLNTNFLQAEFPALYQKYPNHDLIIDITQSSELPPTVTATPEGNIIDNMANMVLNVVDPTASPSKVPICGISFNYTLSAKMDITDNTTNTMYLTGNISPLVFAGTLEWSALPADHLAGDIASFVQGIVDSLAIPMVNQMLARGFPVSTKVPNLNFVLCNVFITYFNKVVAVGFDLKLPWMVEAPAAEKPLLTSFDEKFQQAMEKRLLLQYAAAMFDWFKPQL